MTLVRTFSNEELQSVDNLASIGRDREAALSTLQKIYQAWTPILNARKDFSKSEIPDQARRIKEEFNLREGSLPGDDK